jgi:hypothetical protein
MRHKVVDSSEIGQTALIVRNSRPTLHLMPMVPLLLHNSSKKLNLITVATAHRNLTLIVLLRHHNNSAIALTARSRLRVMQRLVPTVHRRRSRTGLNNKDKARNNKGRVLTKGQSYSRASLILTPITAELMDRRVRGNREISRDKGRTNQTEINRGKVPRGRIHLRNLLLHPFSV